MNWFQLLTILAVGIVLALLFYFVVIKFILLPVVLTVIHAIKS